MVLIYFLVRLQWQCQRSQYHYQVSEPLLLCFIKQYYRGNSFFCVGGGTLYADSICFIFPLESNAWEKSTNDSVALDFFSYSFDDSTDHQNQLYGSISIKAVLIFPINFLNFRSDKIEKLGVINLGIFSRRNYASVVQRSPFWGSGENGLSSISL